MKINKLIKEIFIIFIINPYFLVNLILYFVQNKLRIIDVKLLLMFPQVFHHTPSTGYIVITYISIEN